MDVEFYRLGVEVSEAEPESIDKVSVEYRKMSSGF